MDNSVSLVHSIEKCPFDCIYLAKTKIIHEMGFFATIYDSLSSLTVLLISFDIHYVNNHDNAVPMISFSD